MAVSPPVLVPELQYNMLLSPVLPLWSIPDSTHVGIPNNAHVASVFPTYVGACPPCISRSMHLTWRAAGHAWRMHCPAATFVQSGQLLPLLIMPDYCTAAEEEDPSFLATRRRSSLLAAPRVEYAPFLEAAQRALEDNKNEYLALFKKCGPILRAWPLRRKVVAKYLEGSISHSRCADARAARQIHIWCASAKTPLQNC